MGIREKAKRLKAGIPAVYLTWKDSETPIAAKVLAAVTVVYALSPIDLIPDFMPVLGLLDDVILLPALIALTIRLTPPRVWRRNLMAAEEMWRDGRPKKWVCVIPVLLVWATLSAMVIRMIFV